MVNAKDKVRALAEQYGWELSIRNEPMADLYDLDKQSFMLRRTGNGWIEVWFDTRQRVSEIHIRGVASGTTYRFLEQHMKTLGVK